MKIYFKIIKITQEILLATSILTLMLLPYLTVFYPSIITGNSINILFSISHFFLVFVMLIRPLADIFRTNKWIRPLVILRKGAGVISASIIVSFILGKLMVDPIGYIQNVGTLQYWSMQNLAALAHLADISAIILLITSNNFSRNLLGTTWNTIQKLSYVYFYFSALYVILTFGSISLVIAIILVTTLTLIAFIKNRTLLLKFKTV